VSNHRNNSLFEIFGHRFLEKIFWKITTENCRWKLPESDIFLTFDVFEEKFVWRDKTYAPWNCWVITFTLTPCDDFKNDLEPPRSFIITFEFIQKQGSIDRRWMKSELTKSDQSLLDSLIPKKTKLSNLGKIWPLLLSIKMSISLQVSIILNQDPMSEHHILVCYLMLTNLWF